MTIDSHIFWMTVASVGLGIGISIWQRAKNYINRRKPARLAGGRFDTEETPDMSDEQPNTTPAPALFQAPKFSQWEFATAFNDALQDPNENANQGVAPLVKMLDSGGFYVIATTAANDGAQTVICRTRESKLVSEAERMHRYLRERGLTGFSVEAKYNPGDREYLIGVKVQKSLAFSYRFQISNIIDGDGYRAQIIANKGDIEITGEVDGYAFTFHSVDWWEFGVSLNKLSEAQRADLFTNNKVTAEHPMAQSVTGPWQFRLSAGSLGSVGKSLQPVDAMQIVRECIGKFRQDIKTAAEIAASEQEPEALRESAAIEG
jgi:hypothetical protein